MQTDWWMRIPAIRLANAHATTSETYMCEFGWPTYDTDHTATMRFNTSSQVVDDPRFWERALWGGVR